MKDFLGIGHVASGHGGEGSATFTSCSISHGAVSGVSDGESEGRVVGTFSRIHYSHGICALTSGHSGEGSTFTSCSIGHATVSSRAFQYSVDVMTDSASRGRFVGEAKNFSLGVSHVGFVMSAFVLFPGIGHIGMHGRLAHLVKVELHELVIKALLGVSSAGFNLSTTVIFTVLFDNFSTG